MIIPPSTTAQIIASILFGLTLGFLAQRSRMCVTGAIRDYILFRTDRNLKYLFLLLGIITLVYSILLSTGIGGARTTPFPAGWYSIVGGVIFGFGMVIAGGCVVSTFYRIGEGNINYLIVAISMFVGVAVGAHLYLYAGDYLIAGESATMPGQTSQFIWLGQYDLGALNPSSAAGRALGPIYNPWKLFNVSGVVVGIIQSAILLGGWYYLEKKSA
jgi:uncharacterized membrane protein YedE/YeeE